MLVLSRKKEESIIIGKEGEIVVKILAISGETVKIGVIAPKSIPVHREEVYAAIQAGGPREKKVL